MRFVPISAHGAYLWVIACLLTVSAATFAAEIEPYEARVTVVRAQVRSGPGDNFYPTDTLAQGETVEVYREQEGGWLAIRPPQHSFSWVFGRHLKIRDDGLAEVDKADVDSRIGSRFSNKRNAVQVQLRKGEVVEILGEEQVGSETWYRIAPPAGEFRWIHASDVKPRAPLAAADTSDEVERVVVATSATDESDADVVKTNTTAQAAVAALPESNVQPTSDWRSALGNVAASSPVITPPPLAPAATPPPTVPAPQSTEVPAATVPIQAPVPAVPAVPADAPPVSLPDEITRRLTDIELRLSRMVAAPPDRWNTERLERDTEALFSQAQTAAERDAIQATLTKLDQFDAIARRYQPGAESIQPGAGSTELGGPAAQTGLATTTPDSSPSDTRHPTPDISKYDAVGILRPVVSKRPGAPQFALVDDRGQVISFVTPTPDLNLQPYLGHRIGVVGTRGFIPEFQRAHVTAGRVAPLSERLVR
jgi:uncharacterized protein YgiM (DUF1202 family)